MSEKFYENLKKARLNKGLSQIQLAEKLSIAKSTYSMYETGKREPNIQTIKKLAVLLDVSLDYLLTGKEQNQKEDNINTPTTSNLGEIRLDITPENYEKYKKEFDIAYDHIVEIVANENPDLFFDIPTGKKLTILEFQEKAKQFDNYYKVHILEIFVSHITINPLFNTCNIYMNG